MESQAPVVATQSSEKTPSPANTKGAEGGKRASVQLRGKSFGEQQAALAPGAGGIDAQQQALSPVQLKGGGNTDAVHAAAQRGTAGSGTSLPHLNKIQASFGSHDVSNVQAYMGSAATEASQAMGAEAFATGNKVAFAGTASLHTAAHEAAHVVQQRAGVSLSGGVGKAGDSYEQHADAVADAVVQGKSAEGLLDQMAGRGGKSGVQAKSDAAVQRRDSVQRNPEETHDFTDEEGMHIVGQRYELGSRRPYDVVQDHISGITTALQQMKDGALEAINNFLTHMAFSNSDEAQPDALGAVFKYVGDAVWGAAVGAMPAVAGIPASNLFGIVGAMTDELERAAAAQASYDLATFIATLRSATNDVYTAQITGISGQGATLDQQFMAASGVWEEGDSVVVGDKAGFLQELDQAKTALLNSVPPSSVFEERLIVGWITNNQAGGEGITRSGIIGHHSNGRIEVKFDVDQNDAGDYSFEFENCKLFVSTRSGNAADMLTRVMRQRGKKIYELGIPVLVLLHTENIVGGTSYHGFEIRSRNDYDRENGAGSREADRAWRQMSWTPIDAINNIDGG